MRRHLLLTVAAFLVSEPAATAQVLNMSKDLVSLGIASQNMTPNNSSLDSRPLFQAAVNYVQGHPAIQTLTVDTGAYYLLSATQGNAVVIFPNLTNLTIDLSGSTFFFNGPQLPNGLQLFYCSNVVLTNFKIDFVNPPYTHVQLVSVDTTNRLLHYQTLPGWPDPVTLYNISNRSVVEAFWAAFFRNGSIVPATTRTVLQPPFTSSTIYVPADDPNEGPCNNCESLSALTPGDTIVVTARGGGPPILVWECNGITISNVDIYGSAETAIQVFQSSNSVLDTVRNIPRPGTGLIGSAGDSLHFIQSCPNNHIRNCYVARTMDDGLVMETEYIATVTSQPAQNQLSVARAGYTRFPNGTLLNFLDPATQQSMTAGVIVSQNPPDSASPASSVALTFDRSLPSLAPGTVLVFGAASQLGQGSTIEDNLIEDTYGGHGIWLAGDDGITVQRNVVRRTGAAGIASLTGSNLFPPSSNLSINDNSLEVSLGPQFSGGGELGAIMVKSITPPNLIGTVPTNSNLAIANNYVADSTRSGMWIGEVNGGTLQNNLVIRYSQNPTLGGTWGVDSSNLSEVQQDALLPVVIRSSTGVSETGDTISATSSVVAPVTLMPAGIMWPSAGGSASFNIQTAITGFNWKAVSDSSWLTITSPATGSGAGTIEYSVAANTSGSSRTGVITIAGETFVVKQQSTASLVSTKAGIWRPSAFNMVAEDADGNLAWDSPPDQANFFGANGDIVIFGDWDGSGKTRMGIFRPSVGMFALDMNGNGAWDPGIDTFGFFGQNGDVPIVGDWTGDGKSKIGIFRPTTGLFALDINNNLTWDQGVDLAGKFGQPNDVPIVGKWTNDGKSKVGIFRNGLWELDTNGNLAWESGVDSGGTIGQAGDRPIFGDWNGDGRTKVGIYRPSTGLFGLDYNGNLAWDTGIDMGGVLGPANASPVVGDWTGTGIDRVGILYGSGYWALDTNGAILWDSGIRWGAFGAAGDTAVVGKWQ